MMAIIVVLSPFWALGMLFSAMVHLDDVIAEDSTPREILVAFAQMLVVMLFWPEWVKQRGLQEHK